MIVKYLFQLVFFRQKTGRYMAILFKILYSDIAREVSVLRCLDSRYFSLFNNQLINIVVKG